MIGSSDNNKGAPRSKHFNDVYFSAVDGLAETNYVFLEKNNLPENWKDKEQFVICETGFGTGLNFLAAWKLWDKTTKPDQRLHFISIEKFPLSADQIKNYLEPWANEFPDHLDQMLNHYPILTPGFHRLNFENITLTLIFDDANQALPRLNANVDCWFLDGFKPSENPDMWSDTVFQTMANLSQEGTSFATFTAAGFVKRGLREAGFDVKKVKGFGTKRDMLIGNYQP